MTDRPSSPPFSPLRQLMFRTSSLGKAELLKVRQLRNTWLELTSHQAELTSQARSFYRGPKKHRSLSSKETNLRLEAGGLRRMTNERKARMRPALRLALLAWKMASGVPLSKVERTTSPRWTPPKPEALALAANVGLDRARRWIAASLPSTPSSPLPPPPPTSPTLTEALIPSQLVPDDAA